MFPSTEAVSEHTGLAQCRPTQGEVHAVRPSTHPCLAHPQVWSTVVRVRPLPALRVKGLREAKGRAHVSCSGMVKMGKQGAEPGG